MGKGVQGELELGFHQEGGSEAKQKGRNSLERGVIIGDQHAGQHLQNS